MTGSVASNIRAYYHAKGDLDRTAQVVPVTHVDEPASEFSTPGLKLLRLMALSSEGSVMSKADCVDLWTANVPLEREAAKARRSSAPGPI